MKTKQQQNNNKKHKSLNINNLKQKGGIYMDETIIDMIINTVVAVVSFLLGKLLKKKQK